MRKRRESVSTTAPKKRVARGLDALLGGGKAACKTLPDDVQHELRWMSTTGTKLLFAHMTYDEARELMRLNWPSRYFARLSKIAKRAKL